MSHKKAHKTQKFILRFSVFFVLLCGPTLQGRQAPLVYLIFRTPDFKLWLAKDSQTVAALDHAGFDFAPGDRLVNQVSFSFTAPVQRRAGVHRVEPPGIRRVPQGRLRGHQRLPGIRLQR